MYKISCSAKVRLKGKITVTYPKLITPQKELTEKQQKIWRKFFDKVKEHEEGHIKLYRNFLTQTKLVIGYAENCDKQIATYNYIEQLRIAAKIWFDVELSLHSLKHYNYHLRVGFTIPHPDGIIFQ